MAVSILFRGGIHSRRQFLRSAAAGGSLAFWLNFLAHASGSDKSPDIAAVARQVLTAKHGYQPGDLLSQGDAKAIFEALAQSGLKVEQQDEITRLLLEDSHYLSRELRTGPGLKFMRGTSREPLAFDRLDRLSAMFGGQQLIHDMIRLPNGQTFMSKKPTPGFTDLTMLLPKQANGKTPVDKNFNKPTGKIYTEAALVEAIQKSFVKSK